METLFAFDSVCILFDLELECFCEIGAPKKPPFCYFPWKSLNRVPPMLSFKTEKEGPASDVEALGEEEKNIWWQN